MKLYHGTSIRNLKRILRDGLQPRGTRAGNWKDTVESHPEAVYLTVAYSLYYALCARRGKDRDALILEIDSNKLNPFCLCPDEDFLAEVNRKKFPDKTLYEVTAHYRDELEEWNDAWELSVQHLGNCCYMGDIPPQAITRFAIVPNIGGWIRWSDPTICLPNFQFMGDYYKALSAKLFGDPVEYETDSPYFRLPPDEQLAKITVWERYAYGWRIEEKTAQLVG